MRQHLLWFFNSSVLLATGFFLFLHLTTPPVATPPHLPWPAAITPQATHLALVSYSHSMEEQPMPDFNPTPIILVYPLDGNSNPSGEAQLLFNPPNPPTCDVDTLLPSPNGSFLAI